MEPEADKLIMENINKNIIDIFEYPQTDKVIQTRIVNILARLFNAPEEAEFEGVPNLEDAIHGYGMKP